MDVTFEGGPFHGQTHTIEPEPTRNAVIYWLPDAGPAVDRPDIPGHDEVAEYIYEGDGRAAYVAGILGPEGGTGSAIAGMEDASAG